MHLEATEETATVSDMERRTLLWIMIFLIKFVADRQKTELDQ